MAYTNADREGLKPFNGEIPVDFDLSEISLGQLTSSLVESLNKREPKSLFFKSREVKKLRLDVEKQQFLLNKINSLAQMGEGLANLKADILFSNRFVDQLVQNKWKLAEAQFLVDLNNINVQRETAELETRGLKADIEFKEFKRDAFKVLFDKFIDDVKNEKVDSAQLYALLVQGGIDVNAMMQEELIAQDVKKKKAEVDRLKAETNAIKIRNIVAKVSAEEDIKERREK